MASCQKITMFALIAVGLAVAVVFLNLETRAAHNDLTDLTDELSKMIATEDVTPEGIADHTLECENKLYEFRNWLIAGHLANLVSLACASGGLFWYFNRDDGAGINRTSKSGYHAIGVLPLCLAVCCMLMLCWSGSSWIPNNLEDLSGNCIQNGAAQWMFGGSGILFLAIYFGCEMYTGIRVILCTNGADKLHLKDALATTIMRTPMSAQKREKTEFAHSRDVSILPDQLTDASIPESAEILEPQVQKQDDEANSKISQTATKTSDDSTSLSDLSSDDSTVVLDSTEWRRRLSDRVPTALGRILRDIQDV